MKKQACTACRPSGLAIREDCRKPKGCPPLGKPHRTSPNTPPSGFPLPHPSPGRISFCQNVNATPRESCICGRKGRRWQIREFCAPEPGQLVSRKQLLLDKCTRKGNPVRKRKRNAPAIAPSGFLFALSPEGGFPLQIEKYAGKSTQKSRLPDEFSVG